MTSDDIFGRLEALLRELRAAATAPPEPPESWAKRAFNPSPASAHQGEFNVALVDLLTETLDVLRATAANQETRLEEIAREMSEVRALSENLDAFRERSDRLETELRSAARNVKGVQERAAAFEAALAQTREQHAAALEKKHEQLAGEQATLANELRERIQHVLDEQRVSIRQLALQASEEAVLADRARRATELKLEELSRRIAPPPA
jgi:SMC interacting uncharacterized protein involved in chromosome segregation